MRINEVYIFNNIIEYCNDFDILFKIVINSV